MPEGCGTFAAALRSTPYPLRRLIMAENALSQTMAFLKLLRQNGMLKVGWAEGEIPVHLARKLWEAGLAKMVGEGEPRTGGILLPKVGW